MPALHIPINDNRATLAEAREALESAGVTVDAEEQEDTVVWEFPDLDDADYGINEIDGEPFIDLTVPGPRDSNRRQQLDRAEDLLIDAGITFDTCVGLVGDEPTRHWQMDWSLDGARVVLD